MYSFVVISKTPNEYLERNGGMEDYESRKLNRIWKKTCTIENCRWLKIKNVSLRIGL